MIQTCKNQNIIDVVMRHDYWRAVWINNICYFRTFDDNVIYHSGLYIEQLPRLHEKRRNNNASHR